MKKLTFKDTYNGFVAFNPNWICGLEDNDDVELALYCEITDMYEATGEKEFEQYPIVASIQIVVADPHKSFDESDNKDANRLSLISDMVSYMGGVPVDHDYISTDKSNKDITSHLKIKDACLVTHTHDFGTLAAQRGKGTSFSYPQFKTEDAAKAWVQELIKLYGDTLMMMVGFTLDRPINMIGDTGWKTIEQQVKGSLI